VKATQVGRGVPGVVVTVVAMQHVAVSQCPVELTADPEFEFQPSGQVKLAQVGIGVVVTVVTTGGAAVVHGDAGASVGTGTGTGAAVSHGLPILAEAAGRVMSNAKESILLPPMAQTNFRR